MEPSATSMLAGKVTDMIAAGENIISFNIGEPDFPTPQK
jgi:aspartate/methionine/tyrosine aminotransferase